MGTLENRDVGTPASGERLPRIDFATRPDDYRHWAIEIQGSVATLVMDVAEDWPLAPGYTLKLNSYDLGVDIELYDATQRLRFEHPEVRAVIIASAKDRVFCSGANIGMLARSSPWAKVNFCKFTNETRCAIEDASAHSGQTYICALNGTAAGGGYELALAAEHIILVDDGSSAVSLPEVPLLAVLPGTGGLARLVDKRRVRPDRADVLCTIVEGVKGQRALDWNLVDRLAPRSKLLEVARACAESYAARSDRPRDAVGITFAPLARSFGEEAVTYEHLTVRLDRGRRVADLTVLAPREAPSKELADIHGAGSRFWPLALARELDDAILHLRVNEPELGTWILRTSGDPDIVAAMDALLLAHHRDWLVREIVLYLKRTLKRLDVSSRSLIALIEPGSCFAGTLLELALAADRSYMLHGSFDDGNVRPAAVRATAMNLGPLAKCNGLTRIESRFLGDADGVARVRRRIGEDLDAPAASELGLVTFAPDTLDWEDEVRVAIAERVSLSPDALTGMEANLRFGGPETLESKIFGRLSAWQNWIFQRPNAVGEKGALTLFGTGRAADFDRKRV
ncbi:MAG: 2,3-epoxybenzoyl-CoA dihydrolase [Alphaproteobacteria bacterium]